MSESLRHDLNALLAGGLAPERRRELLEELRDPQSEAATMLAEMRRDARIKLGLADIPGWGDHEGDIRPFRPFELDTERFPEHEDVLAWFDKRLAELKRQAEEKDSQ